MPALADAFPALYRSLLGPPFDRAVPAEEKATCGACAMLAENAPGPAPRPVDGVSRFFRPDTKCCTYDPRLPNFLVGAILDDGSPGAAEGRRRIEARIASGVGVSPQWLHPPRAFTLLYESSRHAFGRAAGLRCPYYAAESGGCTIWAHRDAVCSTWFCKHVAGEDGRRAWMQAKELVSLVEIQLARLALLELHPDALAHERPRTTPLGPEDLDGAPPPAGRRAAEWGRWAGREGELYRRCHEVVRGVTAARLDELLGLDGVISRRALARAIDAALSPELPPVLRFNPATTVEWQADGSVALAAATEHEALLLPGAAYALLVRFRGDEPVARVRERLRAELAADLDEAVLLALWRQRVLVVPDP